MNSKKASANLRKHGVSFREAMETFLDDNGIGRYDEQHSGDEARYIRNGLSVRRLLVVCFTEPADAGRIISAWPADKNAKELYERENSEKGTNR